MRNHFALLGLLMLAAGCGGTPDNAGPAVAAEAAAAGNDARQHDAARTGPVSTPAEAGDASGAVAVAGSELLNPDDAAMVFLYYGLAGLTPPIDAWVDADSRVQYAPAPDKAGKRAALRAELQAGAAAVQGAGRLRLSMQANLSEYDPGYGEFTVRALAPSSMVEYQAFGQKVAVKFANGRSAQIWKVPAEQAQAVRDRIGYAGVDLDVLLGVAGVQPGPGGGTIVTQVLEYELRESRGGTVIGRVQVGKK